MQVKNVVARIQSSLLEENENFFRFFSDSFRLLLVILCVGRALYCCDVREWEILET